VIHDGGEAGRLAVGDLGIGGSQDDLADRFERDAVVPRVEPDQRLAAGFRSIRAGVDEDRLVGRVASCGLQRVLNLSARTDVMAVGRCTRHVRPSLAAGDGGPRPSLSGKAGAGYRGPSRQQLQKRPAVVVVVGHRCDQG